MLSEGEHKWLERLADNGGTWPDRPFLQSVEAHGLMVKGLVEAIDPPRQPGRVKGVPFVRITPAGRTALENTDDQ